MMNVTNVMNRVATYAKKPLGAFDKFTSNMCKNYQSNNVKYIAGLGIASMLLKDGLGCYMYVKQSLNNKDIPEEKRKFVAALDLTNGGLMILTQLIAAATISNAKVQEKMFNKLFGKMMDGPAKAGYEKIIRSTEKFKNISPKQFEEVYTKFGKDVRGFFGIFTSLFAATILAKRVIVPFIATPLADKAKGLLYKDEKQKQGPDTFVKSK